MQRWTFPSFRLPTGTTNSHLKSPHNPKPTHHTQVEAQTHASTNRSRSQGLFQSSQDHVASYNPSPKHSHIERTLRSRITKQKAQNEQLRKNIATLEAKSAYLCRLKELEQEVDQLKKEGRELARREKEVKCFVERDEKKVEGAMRGDDWEDIQAEEDGGWDGDGGDTCRDWASDQGTSGSREGSVERKLEDWERNSLASLLSKEDGTRSLDGDEDEDKRKVKPETYEELKNLVDKQFEELELMSDAMAWRLSK